MEGVTTYIYRSAYHKYFRPMDKYFTPFLVPHSKKGFSTRELREITPEHNEGLNLVPQIMSNHAGDCLATMEKLKALGYGEVNLNFGCPSKTVTAKHRGAGFLAKPEELDHFLEAVFAGTDLKVSVKTRIGKYSPEEFPRILEIYNQYPLEELIVHPRTQQDFYQRPVNQEAYAYAQEHSKHPLCYNGDIFTARDGKRLTERFPQIQAVMVGRGLIADPGLTSALEGEERPGVDRLREFHDEIYRGYCKISAGDKHVLFKMKELWAYLSGPFPEYAKQVKKLKKAQNLRDYESAAAELFALLSRSFAI